MSEKIGILLPSISAPSTEILTLPLEIFDFFSTSILKVEPLNFLVILYLCQSLGRQIDEVLRALKALQISDKNKVAMPENWPNNELIKDKVIIPPPKSVKDAEDRMKNAEGYDWWFTYKSL